MSEITAQDPIIVCRDVQKWYGHSQALKGVSMEVHKIVAKNH